MTWTYLPLQKIVLELYARAHSLHRHSKSLVNAFERVVMRVVQEIMKHHYSPTGPTLGSHKGELLFQAKPPLPYAFAAPESHGSPATSTLRASSRSASPIMMASKLLSNGYVATPPPLKSQGAPTSPRLSTSRWPWTLRRSRGWRASATTRSTPRSCSRRSSSTTSTGRSLVQVLVMILLNVKRNVTSSYGPIHAVSSMSVPPLRISRRRTSLTTASPTQASTETLGGIGRKLLWGFMT
jgi:hypothetical protein